MTLKDSLLVLSDVHRLRGDHLKAVDCAQRAVPETSGPRAAAACFALARAQAAGLAQVSTLKNEIVKHFKQLEIALNRFMF